MEARLEESLDKMEAMDLEANPEATDAIMEWQDVCKEEKNGDIIGELENQYGDQHLAVCSSRQSKKQT
jgi:hypothetical protein